MSFPVKVNGATRQVDAQPETPLLWVLRDQLGLPGTKYGCGVAACGACTVHIDGQTVRSCSIPISAIKGEVTTIEGVSDATARAVQDAWVALDVPQCGYCQSGQIMSAVVLLRAIPRPTDRDIDRAMNGNLCRCATYIRIRAAIHEASRRLEATR